MHAIFHNSIRRDEVSDDVDATSLLSKIRRAIRNNMIVAHLNINSIRNKFTSLKEVRSNNFDILVASETKPDTSFPQVSSILKGICHLSGLTEIDMAEGKWYRLKRVCQKEKFF